MREILIVGAGSVGGFIASNWGDFGSSLKLIGFLDDDSSKHDTLFCGHPVLGGLDLLKKFENPALAIGIAFPQIKLKILSRLKMMGEFHFPALISTHAWVSSGVSIGDGSIIYPGTSINYGSRIGDFVVMNMNCAIGHDAVINDFSSFAPGVNLGGHTYIGEGVEMGIGSATKQFVRIEDYAIVGGQSMVTKRVAANTKVAGVPAKAIAKPVKVYQ